ncbi:MAG: hypothetical protein ACOC0E_11130 [Spirochaetota bacterium]
MPDLRRVAARDRPEHRSRARRACPRGGRNRAGRGARRVGSFQTQKPLHELSGGEPWKLYDPSVDVGKAHNLAPKYPRVENDLNKELNRWHSKMTVRQEGRVIAA